MSNENRIEGTSGNDLLNGGIGADRIQGLDGNDTLIGGVGADRLDGNNDNDSLSGGEGADRINAGNGADTLTGGNGADRFDFHSNDSNAFGLDVITDFEQNDKINLSDFGTRNFSNASTSFNGAVTTVTLANTDFQVSLNGNHTLSASNFIFFGQNDDQNDVNEYPGNWDNSFEDSQNGSSGEDSLSGDDYDDLIFGGGAVVAPTDGNDVIYGHHGNDGLYGNGGNDVIYGDNSLNDNSGFADTLYGGLGDDSMFGGGGNDELYGNYGDDLISGGRGNDTLAGSIGNDIYLFTEKTDYDLVLDFVHGVDIISIERTATMQDFNSVIAQMHSDANGSFINLGNDQGITLAGVTAGELTSSDVYFWG
jgi:Ca2+-binding RTX toxin-like protein